MAEKTPSRRGQLLQVHIEPRLVAWLKKHAAANGLKLFFVVGEALAQYRASKEVPK